MESPELDLPSPAAVWNSIRSDWLILEGVLEGKKSVSYEHRPWQIGMWNGCEELHQLEKTQLVYPDQIQNTDDDSKFAAPLLLIVSSDPQQFLAGFWGGLLSGWNVALANPNWGHQEWRSVRAQIQPNEIWGARIPKAALPITTRISPSRSATPQILIPTGGTSGEIRFIRHTWKTLLCAISGFRQRFAPDIFIDSYCVLPLYHVSGLMQMLRSAISGGQLAIAPFKHLESDSLDRHLPFSFGRGPSGYVGRGKKPPLRTLSLVPTQLQRLLQAQKSAWLSQFHTIFLGGAPAWPNLLDLAQQQQIPLSLSYGMTETAAMVSAQKPEDFLSGDRSSGTPLPQAAIKIFQDSIPLPLDQIGQIAVHSPSIPTHLSPNQTLLTDDLGYLSSDGHLHITGRASQTIISGGEDISPTEVEAAIRSTGQVKDVCVFGIPDAQWGEAVVAVYVPFSKATSIQTLRQALRQALSQSAADRAADEPPTPMLSRYKHPKHWLSLDALPRNAQGKLNRQRLIAQIQPQLDQLSS